MNVFDNYHPDIHSPEFSKELDRLEDEGRVYDRLYKAKIRGKGINLSPDEVKRLITDIDAWVALDRSVF